VWLFFRDYVSSHPLGTMLIVIQSEGLGGDVAVVVWLGLFPFFYVCVISFLLYMLLFRGGIYLCFLEGGVLCVWVCVIVGWVCGLLLCGVRKTDAGGDAFYILYGVRVFEVRFELR
jgi:hypothetical protein